VIFEGGVLKASWQASSVPSGYTVVVTVKNNQGQDLSPPPDIVVTGAEAIISGRAVQPRATLKIWIHAVSPQHEVSPETGPASVELVALVTPVAPVLHFGESGLDIRWTGVADALEFEVELDDQAGNRVFPQPQPTFSSSLRFFHALISGDDLEDLTTYQVKVRAEANNSRSFWSAATTVVIDKSMPGSERLRALLGRLKAAGTRFALGPSVIQSGNITGQFASLLNARGGSLDVRAATVTSTVASVTLRATLDLFHVTGAVGTFVFTEQRSILQLELRYPLGRSTVSQLKTAGLLPADAYGDTHWVDSLAAFEGLELVLTTATWKVMLRSSADTPAWSILGLPAVTPGTIRPQLEVYAPLNERSKRYVPRVTTTLKPGSAGAIPVYLQLPVGDTPWEVGLAAPWYVGNVTSILTLFGGQSLSLPDGLVSLGRLTLKSFLVTHAPNSRTWSWELMVALGRVPGDNTSTEPKWTIIQNVLELEGLSAAVHMDVISTSDGYVASTRGAVAASFTLGALGPLDAVLQIPGFDGTWSLSIATRRSMDLAQAKQLLNGSTTALNTALARVGTTSGFTLEALDIEFKPAVPEITQFSIALSLQSWTVRGLDWLRVDKIRARLLVVNPRQDAARVITGSLEALLTLGSVQFGVLVSFDKGSIWKLRLGAQAAQLPGLPDLHDLITADEFIENVPRGLPTSGSFEMAVFGFTYNAGAQQPYLSEIGFALKSSLDWEILPLFSLNDIDIALNITQAAPTRTAPAPPRVITGSVMGRMTIAGCRFVLSATKPDVGAHWTLRGKLEDQLTLDFNTLLHEQVSATISTPSTYQFPTLTILAAEAQLVPETGAFDLYAYSMLKWSPPNFGNLPVAMAMLGGEVHVAGGNGPKTAVITGSFTLGAVNGFAQISLGTGATDLVVKVAITTGTNPSGANLADGVIGTGTYSSVASPTAFVKPDVFAGAALTVNVTKKVLLLTGTYVAAPTQPASRYASLALVIMPKRAGSSDLGFMLGAALGNWTLTDVSPALAGIDSAIGLKLNRASVLLSTMEAASDTLDPSVAGFLQKGSSVKPGLNLCVELDFNGGLLKNIGSIVSLEGPYTLMAQIPSDPSSAITLSASLGSLTLLERLQFKDIHLVYTRTPAPADRVLKLTGDIIAHLDQDYPFHGDLLVTDKKASFQIQTTRSVPSPLGIPNLTLDSLGFMVGVTYKDSGEKSGTAMAFYGSMSFGAGTVLSGLVALENGTPVLVLVQLLQPSGQPTELSISALFFKATGLTWPQVLDISLYDGQLSWIPGTQNVTWDSSALSALALPQAVTYTPGFHARARAKIFFLPEIALDVALITNAVASATKGLTATAQFTNASDFDWGFIKFTGTRTHGGHTAGPYVSINTRDTQRPFGLGAGIVIMSTDVGDVDINVGKDSMTGSFTLPASAGIFADKQITFTWKDNKFTVDNWPLNDLKLPKFDLKDLHGAGKCSSKVVMDLLPIDTKFNLTASLKISPAVPPKAATLDITITGTFDLLATSSAYKDDPVLRADLGTLTWPVPLPVGGSYDWSALANSFVDAIKNAAKSIFENLLTKPENLAKLSAIAGAKWGIAKAAEYLVCRYDMTEAEAEAAAAAAAGAGVGAASGAACAAGSVAVGGVIAAIVGGVVTVQGQVKTQQQAPVKPATPSLRFDTDTLTIDWSGSSTANVTLFGIGLRGSTSGVVPVSAVTGTLTTVPASQLEFGQTYSATVVASGPGGQGPVSDPGTLFLVAAPVLDTLSFQNGTLTAHWNSIQGAADYEAQVLNSGGNALRLTPDINGTTATVTSSAFNSGGTFQVKARATAMNYRGPWGPARSVTIAVLAAPIGVGTATEGSKVKLSWAQVTGATSYVVVVLDAAGNSLKPPQTTIDQPPGASQATISGQGIVDGARLTVEISGAAVNAVGTPARVSLTLTILSAPAGVKAVFHNRNEGRILEEQHISVTWDQGGATGFTVELRDDKGDAVRQLLPISTIAPAADIWAVLLTNNASYRVALQARKGAGVVSDWAEVPITLTILPVPSGLTATDQAASILATWQPASGQVSYEVQVLSHRGAAGAGPPLEPQPFVIYSGASATIDARSLTAGQLYGVQVRARTTSVIGSWSAPLAFQRVGPPDGLTIKGLAVTRMANTLIARWNEAPAATGYTLQVLEYGFEVPEVRKALRGALALIDTPRLSSQSAYNVRVCGNFGQFTGPYSDPVLVPDRVWKVVQQSGPAFASAVVLSFGGKIWAISGGSDRRRFSSVYSSPDGVHWSRHRDAPFSPRSGAAGVVFGDRIWIFGGASGAQDLNDIWSTMDGDTWEPVTARAPLWAPRTGASAVVFQQRIWIMGGTTTSAGTPPAQYRDIWSSPDGLNWTQVSPYAPWPARLGACIGVLSGQMFLMGGHPVGGRSALRDVWASSDGSNWTPLPEALWPGRSAAASAVVRDTLYVQGGVDQANQYGDLWATRDGSTWVQIDTADPRMPWSPRFGHGLINHQNTLFLAGGDAESASSVCRYRPQVPVPANMVPVLARSVVELNERVFSRSAPSARLSEGSMQPGTGTLMTSASHRIEMAWEPAELSETIALVACASSTPLMTLSWQADTEADVVSCAHWNGTGWTPASAASIAAVPHQGQYFTMAALRGGKMRRCSAQARGSVSASLYALAPSGFPIPDGFLPVVASSAQDLIEELFRVKGAAPTLRSGKLNTPGCSVTATGAAPAFHIEMSLGSDDRHYNVTNTIYACSNVALKQWNWLRDANQFAGTCEVWTNNGWRSVSLQSADGAAALGGLYFYRVEMVNARVMAPFGALITSLNEPATVVFYVPG